MTSKKCVVIDYGIGNVFSVMHALQNLGIEPILSSDHNLIREADRVILPGVGSFGRAAERLRDLRLDESLKHFMSTERPFLGICIGMQLLMSQGHEFGTHEGLNIIPGTVKKVSLKDVDNNPVKVPLIGWFPIAPNIDRTSAAFQATPLAPVSSDAAVYFVHSYAATPEDSDAVLAHVMHAGQPIVAAVQRNNVFGLQFHPERSGEVGLAILKQFLNL